MSHTIILALCLSTGAPAFVPPAFATSAQDPPTAAPPPLLSHEKLQERLRSLAAEHPECVTLLPIGFSREGREITVVRLSPGEPPKARPAILLVANLDGPQVFSSAVALSHAERIARELPSDAHTKAFLDSTTLYILPRANPDAGEARFSSPLAELESGGRSVDNDRDRRQGEDPPSDVNADGRVSWMRWEDPDGEWTLDPHDPRASIKADPAKGQRGRYKLTAEGRDLDHDELVAEDPVRDTWLNQNFPHEWKEHGESSGLFPLEEPEARALADFLLLHKDIALVVTYGELDNLVEKPKAASGGQASRRGVPPAGMAEQDAALMAELGKRYVELTGSKVKGRGVEAGSFQAWTYHHRGLYSLAIALWDIPLEEDKKKLKEAAPDAEKPATEEGGESAAPEKPPDSGPETKPEAKPGEGKRSDKSDKKDEPSPSDDSKRLKWIDSAGESARFLPWTAFEHPELGPVQIGGFAPFARSEPPEAEQAPLAQKQLEFLLSLGGVLPRVALVDCLARELGAGLLDVEAALENAPLLSLQSASGVRADTIRPARVRLVLPEGAELLGGQVMQLVRDVRGSGGRAKLRWLVRGARAEDLRVEVDTDHAGLASARVEVE